MAATIALIATAGVALAGLVAALGLSWRAERRSEYRGKHRIARRSRPDITTPG
jgi:hypothetical protein